MIRGKGIPHEEAGRGSELNYVAPISFFHNHWAPWRIYQPPPPPPPDYDFVSILQSPLVIVVAVAAAVGFSYLARYSSLKPLKSLCLHGSK